MLYMKHKGFTVTIPWDINEKIPTQATHETVYHTSIPFFWHTGDKNPLKEDKKLFNLEITEVQADGDELEFIKNIFGNIPIHHTARVQRWFGDMANFIAHNL